MKYASKTYFFICLLSIFQTLGFSLGFDSGKRFLSCGGTFWEFKVFKLLILFNHWEMRDKR